jgi:hypothetical protein
VTFYGLLTKICGVSTIVYINNTQIYEDESFSSFIIFCKSLSLPLSLSLLVCITKNRQIENLKKKLSVETTDGSERVPREGPEIDVFEMFERERIHSLLMSFIFIIIIIIIINNNSSSIYMYIIRSHMVLCCV